MIALPKSSGVRPIGVGEVLRRIIAKAILKFTKDDVQNTVGCLQLCAGQRAGSEAGVHAMRQIFDDDSTEALLMVDANNAFNSLNRESALRNVQILCPSLAPILINTYRNFSQLFIDGDHLLSSEGTTQGDPLAMVMYAIGILPLIQRVNIDARQIWYADDASAGDKLTNLLKWWNKIEILGPAFGYHPNPSKTRLIVKPDKLEQAKKLFRHTGIQVTAQGGKHLGAAVGSKSFIRDFVSSKVESIVDEIKKLATIAMSKPQAAYAIFTHGFTERWTYLLRTIPDISDMLQPIEDTIRHKLLPALTGRSAFTNVERDLISLPARLGGLGINDPTKVARQQFENSSRVSSALTSNLCQQHYMCNDEIRRSQEQAKNEIHLKNQKSTLDFADNIRAKLTKSQQISMEQSSERGASAWLTAIPLSEFGFSLSKQAFRPGMLSVSDMDGNQPTSPPIAHVATLSASLMPSAVRKEHFPPCATIELEIYLVSFSVRSALMLKLSLPSSHYLVKHSQ